MGTAERFRRFATFEAAGSSPTYARLAGFVAESEAPVALLDGLEPEKRQPNLLFAAVRFLDGPIDDAERLGDFVVDHWEELCQLIRDRSTQTNEAALTVPVSASAASRRGDRYSRQP